MPASETELFTSNASDDTRELSVEEKAKVERQDLVNSFKEKKLEEEAQKNWDRFYLRNKDNFFKDRNWGSKDLEEICYDIDLKSNLVFLEAGCGVGNFIIPFASNFSNLQVQGFDFSKNAIDLLERRLENSTIKVHTAVVDLTEVASSPFMEQADLATLIFVLSAIHPEKHQQAVYNIAKFIKVGASVVVRDYGINDYAMIRFGRGAKLGERFYVRQDGTRAYYFTKEELIEIFEKAGFKKRRCEYLHRHTVNHQKSLNVPRIFVQGWFTKVK